MRARPKAEGADVSVFIAGVCMQEGVNVFEIFSFFKVSMLFKKNKKKKTTVSYSKSFTLIEWIVIILKNHYDLMSWAFNLFLLVRMLEIELRISISQAQASTSSYTLGLNLRYF